MLRIYSLLMFTYISRSVFGKNWDSILVFPTFVKPDRLKVLEESSVTVYCGSSSAVYWSFVSIQDGFYALGHLTSLSAQHLQRNRSLTLNNLLLRDSGMYYCNGTYSNRKFVAPLPVWVKESPEYGSVYPNWVEAPVNGSVILTCGSLEPVMWFSVHWRYLQKHVGNNSVTLYNLQKEHSGRYVCRGVMYPFILNHQNFSIITNIHEILHNNNNE